MSFLLDTDTCSGYIKGNPHAFKRFVQYGGQLYLSTISLGELFKWAFRAKASPRRLHDIEDLVNQDAARKFGEARAAMLDAGTDAPDLDLANAAVALANGLTVVTHNMHDYDHISRAEY